VTGAIAPFSLMCPGRIHFGRGAAARLSEVAAGFGGPVLLVQGATPARTAWADEALAATGRAPIRISVSGEPTLPALEAALATARAGAPRAVVAVGGGAVLDMAKALAALVPATGAVLDHLEVVGRGRPLEHDPLPMVALPTTAGTGAEVTKNAVIGVPEARRKVSLRDARMIPEVAIVDPALTDGLPEAQTLAGGLDALTQVIEPYLCTRANPATDALCRAAIPAGLSALPALMRGEDPGQRDQMAWVSLCGGIALANAGLGAVHGLAGVLGGVTGAPHGALCGALLPHVLRMNAARVTDPAARARLDEVLAMIAAAFGAATPQEAPARLAEWAKAQGLPGLSDMGLTTARHADVAEAAQASSAMKPNPAALSPADLTEILRAAA
jgi:hypothetical protein